MALNERVKYELGDLPYEQSAPSQAGRTNFTPGKADARPGDQNWPEHFLSPVSNAAIEQAGPAEMERVRAVKLGRNIVSDQVLPEPTVTKIVVTTITDAAVWGATTPMHTVTETELKEAAVIEKTDGYDWPDV
jgi:hypothetical protein